MMISLNANMSRVMASRPWNPVWTIISVSGTSLAAAAAPTLLPALFDDLTRRALAQLAILGLLFLLFAGVVRFARRDWFHPLMFPTLYITTVASLPMAYIALTGNSLGSLDAATVTPDVMAVFLLSVVAIVIGVLTGLQSRPRLREPVARPLPGWFMTVGRLILASALATRSYDAVQSAGQAYGTNNVTFGVEGLLETFASIGLLIGVTVIVAAHIAARDGRVIGISDATMLAVFTAVTLFTGSRGELLAPFLLILWAYHTFVRHLRPTVLLSGLAIVILVFQGVAGTRASADFLPESDAVLERVLISIGTPLEVQTRLMAEVPPQPFEHGSTYLASLQRQLPSPVALSLLGEPDNTASFRFRELIGLHSPDYGLGFSLPSEGYLNFGYLGVGLATFIYGALLGWAFRRSRVVHAPIAFLYPLLIATLPLAFRADAVEQVKTVLYPMLALTLLYWVARQGRHELSDVRSTSL